VQGEGKEGFGALKSLMFREPATLEYLLEQLTEAMIDYLRLQIVAGAQAVQIFDSWVGLLGPRTTNRSRFGGSGHRGGGLRSRVPVIYFVNGRAAPARAGRHGGLGRVGARAGGRPWTWRPHGSVRTLALQGNLDRTRCSRRRPRSPG
jgi:uroporphyrinogen decarboxylase